MQSPLKLTEARPYANCVEAPGIFYNDLFTFSMWSKICGLRELGLTFSQISMAKLFRYLKSRGRTMVCQMGLVLNKNPFFNV